MHSSDPSRHYRDIQEYIAAITSDVDGIGFDGFVRDARTQRSVIYSLQCISEAARRIGYHAEEHAPGLDWSGIRGFGNIARHEYGEIDLKTVWEIVEYDLAALSKACAQILAELSNKTP